MIEYYNDKTMWASSKEQGYTTPGWYFWDETQSICYGPFTTKKNAELALYDYILELEKESPLLTERGVVDLIREKLSVKIYCPFQNGVCVDILWDGIEISTSTGYLDN